MTWIWAVVLAFCLGWTIRSWMPEPTHDDDDFARVDGRGSSARFGTAGEDEGL